METAKMIIDRDYTLSSTEENLFCSFVEPLGRCMEDRILCADLEPLSWNVIRLRKQQ